MLKFQSAGLLLDSAVHHSISWNPALILIASGNQGRICECRTGRHAYCEFWSLLQWKGCFTVLCWAVSEHTCNVLPIILHRNSGEYGVFRNNRQDAGHDIHERHVHQLLKEDFASRGRSSWNMHMKHCPWYFTFLIQCVAPFHVERLHPYHLQWVKSLHPEHYPRRMKFTRWCLDLCNKTRYFYSPFFLRMKLFFLGKEASINTMSLPGSKSTQETWNPELSNTDF